MNMGGGGDLVFRAVFLHSKFNFRKERHKARGWDLRVYYASVRLGVALFRLLNGEQNLRVMEPV